MNNLKELEQQLQDLENKSKQVREEIKRQSEKPELEEGKWYWVDRDASGYDNALICFQGKHGEAFGFNHAGKWTEIYGSSSFWSGRDYKITLATTEEVEKALEQEALRLGFVDGVRFKSPIKGDEFTFEGNPTFVDYMKFFVYGTNLVGCVFNPETGKWAEIINKYEDGELYLLNDLLDSVPTLAYYDTNRFYDNEGQEWKEDEWDNIELANQENLEKWKN